MDTFQLFTVGSFRFLYHQICFYWPKASALQVPLKKKKKQTRVLRRCSEEPFFEHFVKPNYSVLKIILLELLRMRGRKLTLGNKLAGGLRHPAFLWPGKTLVLLAVHAHFGPALLAGRRESSTAPWMGTSQETKMTPAQAGDPYQWSQCHIG